MNNKQEIADLERQIENLQESLSAKMNKLDKLRQEALFDFEVGDVWKSDSSDPVIIAQNKWATFEPTDTTFFFLGFCKSLLPYSSFSGFQEGGITYEKMKQYLQKRGYRKIGNVNDAIAKALKSFSA